MHLDLILLLKSLGTGFVVGVGFTLLRLPVPAPSELASIIGIIGIFTGLLVAKMFIH